MKKRNVRVAVVGCGVIGPLHLDCYSKLPCAKIVATCDLRADRAEAAAKKFGAAKWTTSATEIFADPDVDAVSICTDHASHAALACAALAAGKHVLCEKSLARTAADLRKMLTAEKAHPELVAAGIYQHRFEPVPAAVRELVQGGALGRLLLAEGSLLCKRTPEYYRADAWRGTVRGEGGSVLINQAIHYFDLLVWIAGGADKVAAFQGNLAHGDAIETEDTISLALRFAGGALGTFSTTNAAAQKWTNSLRFTGTKGMVELRNDKVHAVEFPGDPKAEARVRAKIEKAVERAAKAFPPGKDYYGTGHLAQIRDFVRAVATGGRPRVTFEDAALSDSLVFAAYRSASRA